MEIIGRPILLIRYGVEVTRLAVAPRVTTRNYAGRLTGRYDDSCPLFAWPAVSFVLGSEE